PARSPCCRAAWACAASPSPPTAVRVARTRSAPSTSRPSACSAAARWRSRARPSRSSCSSSARASTTPIYDFRFSKSAVETLEIWGEEVMMEKLVRAIRESRPDILFTNFQNVFGQHGNHRAMAYATERAFELAGDPNAFPEHFEQGLEPWQPAKFYLPAGRGSGQADFELEATLELDTGAFDQFFGATYEQLGQQSRAYHRSQDMGSWREEVPGVSRLHLAASHVTTPEPDTDLLAGVPFTAPD